MVLNDTLKAMVSSLQEVVQHYFLFPSIGMASRQPLKLEPLHNFHFPSGVAQNVLELTAVVLSVFSAGGSCFQVKQSAGEDYCGKCGCAKRAKRSYQKGLIRQKTESGVSRDSNLILEGWSRHVHKRW